MKKKRLLSALLTTVVAAGLLAGCGKVKENSSTNIEKITVTDRKGEIEVPKNPERVVVLDYGTLDVLEEIGVDNVVGVPKSGLPEYLNKYEDEKYTDVGGVKEFNFETINELNPDLIIISTVQEKMYDTLSEIAPTVMIQLEALNWKDDVKAFAKVFGRESEADKWISDYEAKAKEEGDKIKSEYGEDTTYLSFLASGGQFFIFDGAGFGSVLYDDMGLEKPEGMPAQSDISLPVVTYEGLASIKSDYIFLIATDEDLEQLQSNAIWNSIPAVKENHVIVLKSSPYFNQGYSPIGRELLINEIGGMLNETK